MKKIGAGFTPIQERVLKYPPVQDQLDAIYKGFMVMRGAGVPLHPDTHTWLDQITEIKKMFPK